MVAVPAVTPLTVPVPEPIVATALLLLLQAPNDELFASVVVDATHTVGVPVMVAGNGLTVNTDVVIQPVAVKVYVIIVVPAAAPVTMPVDALTVATDVLLLAHVPVPDVLLNVDVALIQLDSVPSIAVGNGFTVTAVVIKQPVPSV